MPDHRRFLIAAGAAIVGSYYLFFTLRSAGMYFDADDMMNLYQAWSKPFGQVLKANVFFWSDFYRPLGALFYRSIFALSGFNPLPFRILCLAIGMANIGLCYRFAKLVSSSERVAALAALMFAFHPRLLEVWYRIAMVYDLLCFTFFYLAACLYISARRRREVPTKRRSAVIIVCFVCALNMKEAAVTLPVILLTWELLSPPVQLRRLWLVALLALMSLPYIYGKMHGDSALAGNPNYMPEYSWTRFGHSWAHYLEYIFLRSHLRPWQAIALLAFLLCGAMAARSRAMLLAWTIMFFCTLPVLFISFRGGYVLYLSWAGWVLYAAIIIVAAQDLLLRKWPRYRVEIASAVFLVIGWRLGKLSLHEQRTDPRPWLYVPPARIYAMVQQMRALYPVFPRGARLLFLEDAFTSEEWTPYFVMKLGWHDDSMLVDRTKMLNGQTPDLNRYDYVFTYERGLYSQIKK